MDNFVLLFVVIFLLFSTLQPYNFLIFIISLQRFIVLKINVIIHLISRIAANKTIYLVYENLFLFQV